MKATKLVQSKARWFKDAITFACTGCGKCCRGRTNVYVNQAEVSMMQSHLNIPSEADFRSRYMRTDKSSLKNDSSNSHCIFLEGNKCSVYEVRPTQCRTYPFWPQHVLGRAEWEAEAVRCEGMGTVQQQDTAPGTSGNGAAASIPAVSSDALLTTLAVHMVHDRGRGPEWDFETASGLLQESLQQEQGPGQAEAGSVSMIEEFADGLFERYHSTIVYENNLLRVVDLTVTQQQEHQQEHQPEHQQEHLPDDPFGFARMDAEAAAAPTVTVTRRLEFKASPQFSQTEISLVPVPGHFGMYKGQRFQQYRADHSRLLFAAHRAIAAECLAFVRAGGCNAYAEGVDPLDRGQESCGESAGAVVPRTMQVAVIGAGGCALPCHLVDALGSASAATSASAAPRAVVDAVDTEVEVLMAARAHFGAGEFEDNGDLSLHVGDGLAFLENRSLGTISQGCINSHLGGYDIIVLDVCSIDDRGIITTSGGEGLAEEVLWRDLEQWCGAILRAGRRGGGVYINAWGEGWIEGVLRVFACSGHFATVRVIDIAVSEGGQRNAVLSTTIL